jgi:hypothetical protein
MLRSETFGGLRGVDGGRMSSCATLPHDTFLHFCSHVLCFIQPVGMPVLLRQKALQSQSHKQMAQRMIEDSQAL